MFHVVLSRTFGYASYGIYIVIYVLYHGEAMIEVKNQGKLQNILLLIKNSNCTMSDLLQHTCDNVKGVYYSW